MRKLRSFGVNSDMLVTFYNAVICSIIIFGSVCWGGNISKLDRGRLEKIVKKKKKGHVVGKPLDIFKTLHEKRLYRKLMQILLIDDRLYNTILRSLEQTHCARMWLYVSN